jgi:tRNA G18 (ribose-2'-O)-methylase SpoU
MSGSLLIYKLQSPINIGMILRIAEIYRRSVLVRDAHGVFERQAAIRTISDFAVGALQRRPPRMLNDEQVGELVHSTANRLVATTSSAAALDACTFSWRIDDCFILGNEYDGLPAEIEKSASASVRIPMPSGFLPKPKSFDPIDESRTASVANDGEPSLNVATAAAVLCSFAYCALRNVGAECDHR